MYNYLVSFVKNELKIGLLSYIENAQDSKKWGNHVTKKKCDTEQQVMMMEMVLLSYIYICVFN